MRGLAADHASKGNITVIMLVTAVRESDCGGYLERAGHADTVKSRARSLEGTDGAFGLGIGNGFIEARFNYQEMMSHLASTPLVCPARR